MTGNINFVLSCMKCFPAVLRSLLLLLLLLLMLMTTTTITMTSGSAIAYMQAFFSVSVDPKTSALPRCNTKLVC